MRFNREVLVVFLSFVLVAFSFCGDSTSTTQNDNSNTPANFDIEENPIEIPAGLSITGNFDGQDIEVPDADTNTMPLVLDMNTNASLDAGDVLGIFVSSSDAFEIKNKKGALLGLSIDDFAGLRSHKVITLNESYVKVSPDGFDLMNINIKSGIIYFTYLMKVEGGLVAGKFDVILEDERGTLKGKFSGLLHYQNP